METVAAPVGDVVSLPMRDGNRQPSGTARMRETVVSLPMRDGNTVLTCT